jgi:hypothetical protein
MVIWSGLLARVRGRPGTLEVPRDTRAEEDKTMSAPETVSISASGVVAVEATASIDTPEAQRQAPTAVDPRGRELYERLQHAEREARRLEQELEAAKAEHQATVTSTIEVEAIDGNVQTLLALEARVATLTTELAGQRHRVVLLGDALLPHRQQARMRLETSLRTQIAESEHEVRAVNVKIAEHYTEIAALEREAQAIADRARPLTRELHAAGLHASRPLRVTVRFASPWVPPAGVLVKPSAWRAFVEAARAARSTRPRSSSVN